MNNYFYKFPSTPYIYTNDYSDFRFDKMLSKKETIDLFSEKIIIEEKIDGANLGISFDSEGNILLQNRGQYLLPPYFGQWKKLPNWIENYHQVLFDNLEDKFILFGEWCYFTHQIYYDNLPDWFIGFDVFDKQNRCFLSVKKRNKLLEIMNIEKVPQLFSGIISINDINSYIVKSTFGQESMEGLYFRKDYDGQLVMRAKYVRDSFINSISQHWSSGITRKNRMRLL